MTLYRHYKNLPYRYLGVAKHSESLEDLVLYETLYDNPLGKLWVRPKAMFFENIDHNGTVRPRFAKVPIDLVSNTVVDQAIRSEIMAVALKAFDSWSDEDFGERLKKFQKFHVSLALIDGKAVAFKLGYGLSDTLFYSWLGAVLPEYQRSGVGAMLMKTQHQWCIDQGYRSVRTKCLNFNQAMLILNVKHGFQVYDTEITEQGLKLILEKKLVESVEDA